MKKSTQILIIIKYQKKALLVILIDSVYKKDKNYYPQVLFDEFKFQTLQVPSWNIKKKLSLALKISISQKIRNSISVFWGGTFLFFKYWLKCEGFYFSEYRNAFFWENIRKAFFSQNIGNPFRWENISIFLILQLESSISGNIRKFFRGQFFCFFWDWDGKCVRWPYNHTATG